MKFLTTILSSILIAGSMTAYAQQANRLVLHSKTGETIVYNLEDMDYMDFLASGDYTVGMTLDESSLTVDGFSVTFTPSENCGSYKVLLNGTERGTYSETKTVEFTDLTASATYTVAAVPYDIYGIAGETVSLTVTTLAGVSEPKVGDYFYSDGTWSDGGLISIDADGRNAVWSATKPAPIAGKTVIGIVFNTDPNRMAQADRNAGYTHGYVIGCKNITDPGKSNYNLYPESVWYANFEVEIDYFDICKSGKKWYSNLEGRYETTTMLEHYSDNAATMVPMFYYGTTGYPVAAPENTSGWFLPSTGQMWDCIANFCSGIVAQKLLEARTLAYDFTAYFSEETREPVFENFMRVFELVPDTDKDEMTMNDATGSPTSIAMRTSSRYSTDAACHFNLGTDSKGLIEGMAGWTNEEGHARPILAF